MNTFILLLSCSDQKGIVAKITDQLLQVGANILDLDQHCSEDDPPQFFMRLAFVMDANHFESLNQKIKLLMDNLSAEYSLINALHKPKIGILVSKEDHCLQELLYQWKSGSLKIEITGIYSNHNLYQELAKQVELPFYHLTYENKAVAEGKLLEVSEQTEVLVMARFMQILSSDFLKSYQRPVVNIHHSFLPSFKGADPYKQAFDRGVKLIGATAHFATPDLDEGPIITQHVTPVTHRQDSSELKKMGKTLEKQCLTEAIQKICENKVLLYGKKTIVF